MWAYCLMPNHVHLVLAPQTADGLARALGETHRRYTGFVNARARWTGHLFQGRFGSVAMDEAHLSRRRAMWRSTRCGHGSWRGRRMGLVERRARILPAATTPSSGWHRSSTGSAALDDWLASERDAASLAALRPAETTGRPLGADDFIIRIERTLGRSLQPRKPGRKPRVPMGDQLKLDIGNE